MALTFNGTSIYSINYNNQDILNLYHNDKSIWAKRYADARIYRVSELDTSLTISHDVIDSGLIGRYALERKSSLDASPSDFSYSDGSATVHWGDVFRAQGGVANIGTTSKVMTLPSGNNIQIDSNRTIYLSGDVSLNQANAPKLVHRGAIGADEKHYMDFVNFSNFGKHYYTTYWNGVRSGAKASEFCRCWIQVFKATYSSSSGKYTIKSLAFASSIQPNSCNSTYSTSIGGWVLSPSDFVGNSPSFGINPNKFDIPFNQRYIATPGGSSGYTAVWRVLTCYRNGWRSGEYTETFGSTISYLTSDIISTALNNSSVHANQSVTDAIDKCTDDAVNWLWETPYAKS